MTSHSKNRDIPIEYEINDIHDPMVAQLCHPERFEPQDFPVTTIFKLSQLAVLPRKTYSFIQKLAKEHAKYSLSPLFISLELLKNQYGIKENTDSNRIEQIWRKCLNMWKDLKKCIKLS